jgi:hypothetical protein
MLALIAAILIAGILGIFSDWLFMGLLFHDAYNTYPDVWRPKAEQKSSILWASALGFVMSAAVIALCAVAGTQSIWPALGVALLVWLAGPFVVIVVNAMFVKIDIRITFAHGLGYLMRMLIAGLAAGIALPLS